MGDDVYFTHRRLPPTGLCRILTPQIDSEGNQSRCEFDARNQIVHEYFAGHVPGTAAGDLGYDRIEHQYDGIRRPIRRIDQQGDSCQFVYDRANRLLAKHYRTRANSPDGAISDSDVFTFDAVGRITSAASGRYSNLVTSAYDPAGRPVAESLTVAARTYTVRSAYDTANRRTGIFFPDNASPSDPSVVRRYTARDQLSSIDYQGTQVEARQYDDGGRTTGRTLGNGLTEARTYRTDNLIATISTPSVTSFAYTYDANKNRTGEAIGGAMSAFGYSAAYGAEDRLTSWTRTDSSAARTWALTAVGDWATNTVDGTSQSRTHRADHAIETIGGAAVAYDGKGNLITRPGSASTPYAWDFNNRLRSAGSGGGAVDYEYDALGRRISVGGTITVWDCGLEVAEYARGAAADAPKKKV